MCPRAHAHSRSRSNASHPSPATAPLSPFPSLNCKVAARCRLGRAATSQFREGKGERGGGRRRRAPDPAAPTRTPHETLAVAAIAMRHEVAAPGLGLPLARLGAAGFDPGVGSGLLPLALVWGGGGSGGLGLLGLPLTRLGAAGLDPGVGSGLLPLALVWGGGGFWWVGAAGLASGLPWGC